MKKCEKRNIIYQINRRLKHNFFNWSGNGTVLIVIVCSVVLMLSVCLYVCLLYPVFGYRKTAVGGSVAERLGLPDL